MKPELWKMVNEYRRQGISISDEEAERIYEFCYRKMEIAGIGNIEEYLPELYLDELKGYLLRVAINATTTLQMIGRK